MELNGFYYNPRNLKYSAEGASQETGWDQREFYLTEKEINPKSSPGRSELSFTMYEISTSLYNVMTSDDSKKEVDDKNDW